MHLVQCTRLEQQRVGQASIYKIKRTRTCTPHPASICIRSGGPERERYIYSVAYTYIYGTRSAVPLFFLIFVFLGGSFFSFLSLSVAGHLAASFADASRVGPFCA